MPYIAHNEAGGRNPNVPRLPERRPALRGRSPASERSLAPALVRLS